MDEKNKQKTRQAGKSNDAPETNTGVTAAKSSAWKRLLAKKWVYPALYIAAVAIILSLMWVYQGSDTNVLEDEQRDLTVMNDDFVSDEVALNADMVSDLDALPVTVPSESMQWPVEDFDQIEVIMPFYDRASTNEAKQAAVIEYGDTFIPSTGISLSRQDDEAFQVVAAMSGVVTLVEQHPLVGHQIEITHGDGLKTVYQSLSDVMVQMNDQISQGDVIAKAGRNELEKDLGVHLRFEVHQDQIPVDPEVYIADS